MGRENG